MATKAFMQVRERLGRVMEALKTANTVEDRAKLEEDVKLLAAELKNMKTVLREMADKASGNNGSQEQQLSHLRNMEMEADVMVGKILDVVKSTKQ
jgi:hypothetical protein